MITYHHERDPYRTHTAHISFEPDAEEEAEIHRIGRELSALMGHEAYQAWLFERMTNPHYDSFLEAMQAKRAEYVVVESEPVSVNLPLEIG